MPIRRSRRNSKRTARRSFRKRGVPRSISVYRRPHCFKRNYDVGTIAGSVAYAPYLGSHSFALTYLPNVTEFTNLYDQYKVTHIKLRYHLRQDPGAQTAVNSVYPRMFYCIDRDDASIPTSIDSLRQHQDVKMKTLAPNRDIVINYKPTTLRSLYVSAISTTYEAVSNIWCDMANINLPFYGMKYAFDYLTNTDYRVDVEATVYFRCKNVR